MKLKKIWVVILWIGGLVARLLSFLVKNPQAIPAVVKYLILRLPTLPRRLLHKANIDEERTKIKQELVECNLLFERMSGCGETFDIRQFQEILSPASTNWASLYLLVRALKPALVVETGVAEGVSTTFILQALADNHKGFLFSIDLPNQFYIPNKGNFVATFNPVYESPGCLVPMELRDRWELILGRSCDVLPGLFKRLGQIDLFLHDSEHTYEHGLRMCVCLALHSLWGLSGSRRCYLEHGLLRFC